MARDVEALLARMRANPGDVRYADACRVVSAFFGKPRRKGTSHQVWKMPWAGDPRVNLQPGENGKAKAYQVRQVLEAIDRLRAQTAKEAEAHVETRSKD